MTVDPETVVSPTVPESTRLYVAEGAMLNLDYPGTKVVKTLSLGGVQCATACKGEQQVHLRRTAGRRTCVIKAYEYGPNPQMQFLGNERVLDEVSPV